MNHTILTLHELAQARAEYFDRLEEGRMDNHEKQFMADNAEMWYAAYSDKCDEIEQLSQRLREAHAQIDRSRRWACAWKRLAKKWGYVIHNFRSGRICRVQQQRIEELEKENERRNLSENVAVTEADGELFQKLTVHREHLRALRDALARQGRKG